MDGQCGPSGEVLVGGFGPEEGAGGLQGTFFYLLMCLVSTWCRLYSHIQLASKLTSGCDYSLFKVRHPLRCSSSSEPSAAPSIMGAHWVLVGLAGCPGHRVEGGA